MIRHDRSLRNIPLNAESLFDQEELEEPTFNYYVNTVKEFKAPFLNKDSNVYREGLRLVSLETKIEPCFYQEKLVKFGTSGKYCWFLHLNHRHYLYKRRLRSCKLINTFLKPYLFLNHVHNKY